MVMKIIFFRKNLLWVKYDLHMFLTGFTITYDWLSIKDGQSIKQTLLIWWKLTGVCYIPARRVGIRPAGEGRWYDKCLFYNFTLLSPV